MKNIILFPFTKIVKLQFKMPLCPHLLIVALYIHPNCNSYLIH